MHGVASSCTVCICAVCNWSGKTKLNVCSLEVKFVNCANCMRLMYNGWSRATKHCFKKEMLGFLMNDYTTCSHDKLRCVQQSEITGGPLLRRERLGPKALRPAYSCDRIYKWTLPKNEEI